MTGAAALSPILKPILLDFNSLCPHQLFLSYTRTFHALFKTEVHSTFWHYFSQTLAHIYALHCINRPMTDNKIAHSVLSSSSLFPTPIWKTQRSGTHSNTTKIKPILPKYNEQDKAFFRPKKSQKISKYTSKNNNFRLFIWWIFDVWPYFL